MILGLINAPSTTVSTFENLMHLKMEYTQGDTILEFLKFTPNLESLVIAQYLSRTVNKDAITLSLVPRCLLLHLKTIEVREFKERSEELKLVKCFLENAIVLQMLTIKSGMTPNSVAELEMKTRMTELLQMYPRASTNCTVNLPFPK
ncbi:hypothetical protein MKW94_003656 [Papaver nudicaule]|uniref:FBD domain-containing protein n=1 Tax=Papaver nudicaule TaxID=74823 RepID=A0AA41UUD3_PAPNU|nr:hypothetical protein [Papaver nudicaule]